MTVEHAYDPTREGAPQMCLCGDAFRTREEVKAHVRNPGPQRVRLLPVCVPVDDEAAPSGPRYVEWPCGCGQTHRAICPKYERRRRAA